jgi:hypothetical protein
MYWNSKWEQFKNENPNASLSQIFYQAELMIRDVGPLRELALIGYEKYKFSFFRKNSEFRKKL